ncbi:N-acetylgalactosamine-4-sulfatase [Planctomycetales bacterium 10988]|nr:N-acetylgalactosamine-4-sulfatase [Planctomycetales bacterium 10988]
MTLFIKPLSLGGMLFLCLILSLESSFAQNRAKANERPNIVLLFADDLGYGELGCQGNPEIPTPHIDSIAANGIRFTQGYVTASYCSASRAGLITGRYQVRFGYDFNPIGYLNEDPRLGLPPEETTLPEHLQQTGYATGIVGKWHLGGTAKYHPLHHGFESFFGFLHEGHYFVPPPYRGVTTMLRRKALPDGTHGRWVRPDGRLILSTHMGSAEPAYNAGNPILHDSQPVNETEYLTDAFTREAVAFIEEHQSRPFFLYVPYNAVHSPLQGAESYMERFAEIPDVHRRVFAAMLSNLDDSVGTILQKLEETGLRENTLVIFLSDNGGPTRELTSSNLPLRGEKGSLYEGGLRIPFMLQWPARLPAGEVYREPIISLDLLPTIAAATATPLRNQEQLDGVDLLPYLTGERPGRPHDRLFWRQKKRAALRFEDWKLVKNPGRGEPDGWQLFDLRDDIGEQRNLAEKEPERLQKLVKMWEDWNEPMPEAIQPTK